MATKYIVPIVAIVSVAGIEVTAILKGINGAAFGVAVATIGGICGYWVKSLKK